MFDINNIINAALNAAVTTAITPLLERIDNLDAICQTQHEAMVAMRDRIAALETKLTEAALFTQTNNVTIPIDEAKMVEALNDQEWFWEKMQRFAAGAAEAAMDDHTSTYDHDSYDAVVSDSDDFVKSDVLEEAVREAIDNLTFEVSVS